MKDLRDFLIASGIKQEVADYITKNFRVSELDVGNIKEMREGKGNSIFDDIYRKIKRRKAVILTEEEKEAIISSTNLPVKIKEELAEKLRGVRISGAKLDKIIKEVERKYENAKVEPCEAVGIIAAQSIGEPGTQMSLPGHEKIIICENGTIRIRKIGEFVDELMDKFGYERFSESDVCDLPENIGFLVPSLDQDGNIRWKRILSCSRHKSPKKILRVETRSGRKILSTDSHSFVVKKEGRIIPISGRELSLDDRLPVIRRIPQPHPTLGIRDCLKVENELPDYVYGADESTICSLLRNYFDRNGDVDLQRGIIILDSSSEELIDGISLLLNRLGVFSKKIKEDGKGELHISHRYAPVFLEKIASDEKEKMDKLSKLCELRDADSVEDEDCDVIWDEIKSISYEDADTEHVYDISVNGLETFATFDGIITHNTMRTFHYAGVGAIYVTLGLPRIIEIVDARDPSTPAMKIRLEKEYAGEKEKAEEVAVKIEETRLSHVGRIETLEREDNNIIFIKLDRNELDKRKINKEEIVAKVEEMIKKMERKEKEAEEVEIEILPEEDIIVVKAPSYRMLMKMEDQLPNILLKGIEGIKRVVVRYDNERKEYMLYTEGSALKKVMQIEGVDYRRTITNNINEIASVLGIEAARNAIIEEMMSTLEEQGLNVDIRHIMLIADMTTVDGEIKQIGRHGVAGEKASVISRAAFEVTVKHLLDAALYGKRDELKGVIENVIVGQPIKLGTGGIELVARRYGEAA